MPPRVDAALSAARPDCVINAAAYNFVDRAEDEPAAAYSVNALGPRNLARWCGRAGVTLLHVSTDYVFGADSTRTGPYGESDVARTPKRLRGEQAGRRALRAGRMPAALHRPHLRTLRIGLDRGQRKLRQDDAAPRERAPGAGHRQRPALHAQLRRRRGGRHRPLDRNRSYGLYHATNSGGTTWYEFAREIFRLAAIDIAVRPITSAEYPQKAKRPAYSVLDCDKLAETIGGHLPAWDEALHRYLHQLG